MKSLLPIILFCSSVVLLQPFTAQASSTLYIVQASQPSDASLYFQGNVQPIRQHDVLAPIAGIISSNVNFVYGDKVKKGQYLFSMTPSGQENTYRQTLIAYLRAKSAYNTAVAKFAGQTLLYKKGIMARNDYTQFKNNIIDQKLAMQEAYYSLQNVVKKINNDQGIDNTILRNIENLSISDQKVYSELNRSFDEVKIHSPANGIVLLPKKSGDSSDASGSSDPLHKDSVLKLNQVLLTIGDFTGLQVQVDVSEVSINKIRKGQSVQVTGPAFPGMTLHGNVSAISYQAISASFGGSLPTYPITVQVAKLTSAEQTIIHPGMTAQVKISLNQGKQISIPIDAVSLDKGVATVMLMKKGKASKVTVTTGNTSLNQVDILTGLTAGDKIVIPH